MPRYQSLTPFYQRCSNPIPSLYQLYTKSMVTPRYLRGTADAHQWFPPYRWHNKFAPHTFVSE